MPHPAGMNSRVARGKNLQLGGGGPNRMPEFVGKVFPHDLQQIQLPAAAGKHPSCGRHDVQAQHPRHGRIISHDPEKV